jgi:hypothetical protein
MSEQLKTCCAKHSGGQCAHGKCVPNVAVTCALQVPMPDEMTGLAGLLNSVGTKVR